MYNYVHVNLKGKQMVDVKLKNSVYAVVNVETGVVLAASRNREQSREELQFLKSKESNPNALKIAKFSSVEKFVR